MQPIVNGLEQKFNGQVEFLAYNAQDGADGTSFFRQLTLPGHPSFVIYAADRQQLYRGVGLVSEAQLRQQIEAALTEN